MSGSQRVKPSTRGAVASSHASDECAAFKEKFPKRFSVRLHMTLLLFGVYFSGLLFSKVLFELGMRSMPERYVIAVCASYAVFFLMIRIWLWYVTGSPKKSRRSLPDIDIDVGDITGDDIQGGTRAFHRAADTAFSGHGGDFGGGGDTDEWDSFITPKSVASSTTGHASSSHGGSGGGGFDFGDDAIVLIALAAFVLAIFGAGVYLVWAAPSILSEAAFQALLAAGLIRASGKITQRDWMGSVLRSTCVPFLIVLLMAGIFGSVAQKYYPHATRLADIFTSVNAERR